MGSVWSSGIQSHFLKDQLPQEAATTVQSVGGVIVSSKAAYPFQVMADVLHNTANETTWSQEKHTYNLSFFASKV